MFETGKRCSESMSVSNHCFENFPVDTRFISEDNSPHFLTVHPYFGVKGPSYKLEQANRVTPRFRSICRGVRIGSLMTPIVRVNDHPGSGLDDPCFEARGVSRCQTSKTIAWRIDMKQVQKLLSLLSAFGQRLP
jgi:hypothetical protein